MESMDGEWRVSGMILTAHDFVIKGLTVTSQERSLRLARVINSGIKEVP
jgi:hypothetical protein